MPRWYDRAVDELEKMLDEGQISNEDFQAEIRELNRELQSSAEEAAEQAYNDHMGYY